jgi:hypothetical protein
VRGARPCRLADEPVAAVQKAALRQALSGADALLSDRHDANVAEIIARHAGQGAVLATAHLVMAFA